MVVEPGTRAEKPAPTGDRRVIALTGDHRVIISSRGAIRIWDLDVDELLGITQRTVGRNLSQEEWRTFFPVDEPHRETFPGLPVPQDRRV
jgi:hypothetical protein